MKRGLTTTLIFGLLMMVSLSNVTAAPSSNQGNIVFQEDFNDLSINESTASGSILHWDDPGYDATVNPYWSQSFESYVFNETGPDPTFVSFGTYHDGSNRSWSIFRSGGLNISSPDFLEISYTGSLLDTYASPSHNTDGWGIQIGVTGLMPNGENGTYILMIQNGVTNGFDHDKDSISLVWAKSSVFPTDLIIAKIILLMDARSRSTMKNIA